MALSLNIKRLGSFKSWARDGISSAKKLHKLFEVLAFHKTPPLVQPLDNEWCYTEQQQWSEVCPLAGAHQSPIHIHDKDIFKASNIFPGYYPLTINYSKNSKKIQLTARGMLTFGDFGSISITTPEKKTRTFDTIQFHFHAPCEHIINKQQYDLELHVVHTERGNSSLVVLGYMFKKGNTPHPFIDQVMAASEKASELDLNLVAEKVPSFYLYQGSLTTPPCTETVLWMLSSEVLTLDVKQLKFFTKNWSDNKEFARGKGNNRALQDLNDRAIVYFQPK